MNTIDKRQMQIVSLSYHQVTVLLDTLATQAVQFDRKWFTTDMRRIADAFGRLEYFDEIMNLITPQKIG